jgi:preprotein translocase SecE subunit
MASITQNGEKPMAEDQHDDRPDEAPDKESPDKEDGEGASYRAPTVEPAAGFFHVYKSGQGYWTRMGTVGGAALVILMVGNFFYTYLPTWSDYLNTHSRAMIGIVLAIVAGLSLLTFWIINKPANVDFLIATDSEMKKVNWTSKKELIGSTKVVVIFVLLITAILFVIDVIFGYIFHWIGVLRQPPF